jgi:hypothetical protein
MKRLKYVIVFILLAVALAFALPEVACPVDGLNAKWTGRDEYVELVRMHVYRCPRGHEFLVRAR